MLQKISDFIKSELQSMLKNRQQSQNFSRGAAPGPRWGLAPPTFFFVEGYVLKGHVG